MYLVFTISIINKGKLVILFLKWTMIMCLCLKLQIQFEGIMNKIENVRNLFLSCFTPVNEKLDLVLQNPYLLLISRCMLEFE